MSFVNIHERLQGLDFQFILSADRKLHTESNQHFMGAPSNQEYLQRQYQDSSNLSARAGLHARFNTDEYPWFQWLFDHFAIPENGRVLELGCGTGLLWRENLGRIPHGWRLTLSDASPGMVQEVAQTLRHTDLQFTFEVVDAQSIPYEKHSFDVVIANYMLYHVPDLARALSEIRRVLQPGGRLYATTVGLNHMAELRKVPRKLGIGTSDKSEQTVAMFNLDNGAEMLAERFAEVEVEHRKGALVVTEAAPLVEYVMSYMSLSDEEAVELHAYFDKEIQLKGAFRITTESGIFKVTKES